MSIVIDASVALAWVFGDERHDAAWQVLERLRQAPAWVPAHFHLEVGNGLLTGLRRGRLTPEETRTANVALGALPIEEWIRTRPVVHSPTLWRSLRIMD